MLGFFRTFQMTKEGLFLRPEEVNKGSEIVPVFSGENHGFFLYSFWGFFFLFRYSGAGAGAGGLYIGT